MLKFKILFLLLFSLTSCTSIVNMSSSAEGRKEMLTNVAEGFHKDLYWKAYDRLGEKIVPAYRETYVRNVSESCKKEKIMEVEVKSITYFEDSMKARILIEIKSFKEPTYTVQTRKELETWKFVSLEGGWLMESSELQ